MQARTTRIYAARSWLVSPIRWQLVAPATRVEILGVGMATALIFVHAYLVSPARPGSTPGGLGFFGWYDQREYLSILTILQSGRLPSPDEFTYGLAYPFLGLGFKAIGIDSDPFVIPDLALLVIAMASTYVVALRIVGRAGAVVVVSLLLVATPVIPMAIVPWTSTVTLAGFAIALLIATGGPMTRGRAATLGLAIGAVFASRYLDAASIVVVAAWCVFTTARSHRLRVILFTVLPAAVIGALVLASHYVILGSIFLTPYASHYRSGGTSDQSLSHYSAKAMVVHLIETYFTARDGGVPVDASPLLVVSPFLFLLPVGVWCAIQGSSAHRSLHILVIVTTIGISALYLSFVAGGGIDLLYRNYRYWVPYYPYWTVLSMLGVVRAIEWLRRGVPAGARAGIDP